MQEQPVIAITMGDPAGIGPEIIAKCLAVPGINALARTVVIGSVEAMQWGIEAANARVVIERVSEAELPPLASPAGVIRVLDSGHLPARDFLPARETAAAGEAQFQWGLQAERLQLQGLIAAQASAPINTTALKLAGHEIPSSAADGDSTYLFLVSGNLRVAHLTDHVTVRQMVDMVTQQRVLRGLETMQESLAHWGIPEARIGVAGLNAHANGPEEEREIRPAVREARARNIRAEGPIPPDSVFRQCIEGKYDVVLAMHHDQGHIAVKTWGFVGNIAMTLGSPLVRVGTAHGTAYDIAGKGIARHEMLLAAIKTAASLSAGRGFPQA